MQNEQRKRGRPPGPPKSPKNFRLEDRQIAYLGAFRAVASLGTPTFTSLITQAVDEYIERCLADKQLKQRVEAFLNTERVVHLRQVKK